jgi:hypothetical protein
VSAIRVVSVIIFIRVIRVIRRFITSETANLSAARGLWVVSSALGRNSFTYPEEPNNLFTLIPLMLLVTLIN